MTADLQVSLLCNIIKVFKTCPPQAFELHMDVDKEKWAVSTFIHMVDGHII